MSALSIAELGLTDEDVLRRLLAPITPEEFVQEYWDRKPLYIRGTPEKFADLFSMEKFVKALQRQHEVGLWIRVSKDSEDNDKDVGAHVTIDASEFKSYFAQGASVCVDPIDRADPKLADLALKVKRALRHAGGISVKCYLSPDRSGFNTHFDTGASTTLQIQGKKRWRFSQQRGLPFPVHNAMVTASGEVRYVGRLPSSIQPWEHVEGVDASTFDEVLLEPGDVLYLPGGTWHNAKAVKGSMALNFSFAALPFLDLLQAALAQMLVSRAEWRQTIPTMLTLPDGESQSQTEVSGEISDEIKAFFQNRLQELRELLNTFDPLDERLLQAWHSAVQGQSIASRGGRQIRPQRAEHALSTAPTPATKADETPVQAEGAATPLGYTNKLSCSFHVKNLKQAIAWYQEMLGFTLVYAVEEFGWCEMETTMPGLRIGLSELANPGVQGGALLNFGVENVDAARSFLEEHAVHFDGPTRVISGMAKLAAFRDPDGNRLMLYEEA